METQSEKKACFVIGPIGTPDSPTRQVTDQLFRHIIKKVTDKLNYEAVRAHELPNPGIITQQVIERLFFADLVIADLTEHNPNVFYELAIRHANRKPVVHVIQSTWSLPFDVAQNRTIAFDLTNPDKIDEAKEELERQIAALEAEPEKSDNPITQAMQILQLTSSDNPNDKAYGEIMTKLSEIEQSILLLKERMFYTIPKVTVTRASAGENVTCFHESLRPFEAHANNFAVGGTRTAEVSVCAPSDNVLNVSKLPNAPWSIISCD